MPEMGEHKDLNQSQKWQVMNGGRVLLPIVKWQVTKKNIMGNLQDKK